jgi:hypothetical protein
MADAHLSPDDVAGYWTPDLTTEAAERIEAHVFACGACAQQLDAARGTIDGIRQAVRRGQFQAIVTDAVLNRLARDGTRLRTFTVAPGDVVPCAVWAGDQVIVTRMRGSFSDLPAVTVVTEVNGEELSRITDVPVAADATELVAAFPADQLRQLPQATVRLRVFGAGGAADQALVGEYTLEHGGTMERSGPDA